ncbi:MAG: hypothetical protein KME07_17390 [Pegethrix bostrychoides GSE-TBD4-15B]|uniref:Uncharacterized protein n=1 Tax=Pegethrix bostrychoides GSE-TBD4-15B TaxID=2839662 RepID=A0A951U5W3_9CYAN|nr:hypothetical protein [Pegethrix bostrychoides GSE-TBD4-15B]
MTRELPEALRAAQVDLLLVDQVVPGGGTVAEFLEMPFVTVCCALATYGLVVALGNRQSNNHQRSAWSCCTSVLDRCR